MSRSAPLPWAHPHLSPAMCYPPEEKIKRIKDTWLRRLSEIWAVLAQAAVGHLVRAVFLVPPTPGWWGTVKSSRWLWPQPPGSPWEGTSSPSQQQVDPAGATQLCLHCSLQTESASCWLLVTQHKVWGKSGTAHGTAESPLIQPMHELLILATPFPTTLAVSVRQPR